MGIDCIPCSELRAHLADTLKTLELRDEPVFISRRGEAIAVLMSVGQYQRLQGGPTDFRTAMLAWREHHAAEMATAGDEDWPDPFADVRDARPDGGKPALDGQAVLAERTAKPPARGSKIEAKVRAKVQAKMKAPKRSGRASR
jgi:prevent-host-death family protein